MRKLFLDIFEHKINSLPATNSFIILLIFNSIIAKERFLSSFEGTYTRAHSSLDYQKQISNLNL